ncbi:MAG: hypothetical protein ACKVP3_07500 [Hyphomicrobiaceae bacterium]
MKQLKRFTKLGQAVAEDWRRQHHDYSAFPEIATRCIEAADLSRAFEVDELTSFIARARGLSFQSDAVDFGDPPVTLFQTDRFVVDALFWVHPDTAVHDHGFSGAFSVLSGQTLHSLYEFDVEEVVDEKIAIGRLCFRRNELLDAGAVRTIRSGSCFIHQTTHLARPTVSLVVRTRRDRKIRYQRTYIPPFLSKAYVVDPEDPNREWILLRQLKLLRSLFEIGDRNFEGLVRETVKTLCPYDLCRFLEHLATYIGSAALLRSIVANLRGPSWLLRVTESILTLKAREKMDLNDLVDCDQKLVAALLSSFSDREWILRLLGRGRGPAFFAKHLRKLSSTGVLGFKLTDFHVDLVEAHLRHGSMDGVLAELGLTSAANRRLVSRVYSNLRETRILSGMLG